MQSDNEDENRNISYTDEIFGVPRIGHTRNATISFTHEISFHLLTFTLLAISTAGIILNSISLATLSQGNIKNQSRGTPPKRRTSELYLIHISFNDLLFSIGLLPQVFTRSTKIQMGDNGCKIMLGMTYLNMYASIFFVTIMTVDRYIAVVFGPNNSSFRKWRSRSSIQFQVYSVWLSSLLLTLPVFIFAVESNSSVKNIHMTDHPMCHFKYWSHSWAVFHCVFRLLMCWFLPSLIILISNCALMLFLRRRYNNGKNNRISGERSKKLNRRAPVRKACRYRTTGIITTGRRIIGKITISVTAIVLICWMPDQILSFYIGIKHDIHTEDSTSRHYRHDTIAMHTIYLKYIFKLLLYATAVINPLIYCFMIRSFRSRLRKLFRLKTVQTKKELIQERRMIVSSLIETTIGPISSQSIYRQVQNGQNSTVHKNMSLVQAYQR